MIKTNTLPVCYYPTTVVFVDDNASFLDSIVLQCSKIALCKKFVDAQEALDFINHYQYQSFIQHCTTQNEGDNEDTNIHVELRNIYRHIYDEARFNEISVAVVDYSMPIMNGIEFCSQVKNKEFLRAMLTGETDEVQAVKAFNAGIIDKFHQKNESLGREVLNLLREAQIEYFQRQTSVITNSWIHSLDHPYVPDCLQDEKIIKPFFDVLDLHGVVEYYLFSTEGYFLLANAEGGISWLAIKSEAEMDSLYDLASSVQAQAPWPEGEKVLKEIQEKAILPLFLKDEDSNLNLAAWAHFSAPTQQIRSGNKTYYYAIFDNDELKFRPGNIAGFIQA